MTDGGIASFAGKYAFRFWRPYNAIRRADEDRNRLTTVDRDWLPFLWTDPEIIPPRFFIPPIPEYPSTGAVVSAAAAEVLIRNLGNRHEFEATSESLPGVTRRFHSLAQAAKENQMSQVYGGIHFLHAVNDGYLLGKGIGRDISVMLPPADRR